MQTVETVLTVLIEDLKKYQENIRYGCMDKPAHLIIRLFFGFASDLSN